MLLLLIDNHVLESWSSPEGTRMGLGSYRQVMIGVSIGVVISVGMKGWGLTVN